VCPPPKELIAEVMGRRCEYAEYRNRARVSQGRSALCATQRHQANHPKAQNESYRTLLDKLVMSLGVVRLGRQQQAGGLGLPGRAETASLRALGPRRFDLEPQPQSGLQAGLVLQR
jgi:hypothetical protein